MLQNDRNELQNNFHTLIKNTEFVCLALSLSGIYFIVTGIQFWMPSYMKQVLRAEANDAATVYMVLTFSGPIGGVICGGLWTTYFGGYNSYKGQVVQCFVGLFAVASAIPIPFMDSLVGFSAFMWLLLFFGGALVPPVTGIMLNCVPELMRTSGSSLAQMFYNSLGYLPAPTFYGWVANMVGDPNSKIPLSCLLYSSLVTISVCVFGIRSKLVKEAE